MRTHFRQAVTTLALAAAGGALSAATAFAQTTVITQEPVETRTIVRQPPLNLTPAQRTTIYRTILPQGRGRQPIVKEKVVTETVGRTPVRERVVTTPAVRERVVTTPAAAPPVVAAPVEVEYVVGDRIPATAPLSVLPPTVATQIPAVSPYRYMVVNDRLLLVDPVTSTVVAEIRQ